MPARHAFDVVATSSTTMAMDAAPSHVASQRSPVGCRAPTTAAISPMMPVTTPPAPGTAVKVDARSIADVGEIVCRPVADHARLGLGHSMNTVVPRTIFLQRTLQREPQMGWYDITRY